MTRSDAPLRVLVTGAAGFVGTHVISALREAGHRVVALQYRNSLSSAIAAQCDEVVVGDICDRQIFRQALRHVNGVCHLAAYVPDRVDDLEDAETCYRVNALATLALATAASQQGIQRFVYASSGNMYVQADGMRTEIDQVFPVEIATGYFASKVAGELYVTRVFRQRQAAALILRIGTPYGPGEPDRKVVTTFMRRAARGQPLNVLADGKAAYNFVYVDDVVDCVVKALQSGPSGIYNVGSGEHTTLCNLAETVAQVYDDRQVTVHIESRGARSPGFAALSIEKASRVLSYVPRRLYAGLRQYRAALEEGEGLADQ